MLKKTIIVASVLVTFIATGSAFAQWGRCGKRAMGPGYAAATAGSILSPDQQKSMNSLRQAFVKETAPVTAALQQQQIEMNSLMLDPAPDAAKVAALQKEISGLQAQLDAKRVYYQVEARKLLSADQVAQLPPGCVMGFGGPSYCGMGAGRGCGMGSGYGRGRGMGCGMGCW